MANTPISTDLLVLSQSINVDIESIAPIRGFAADAFDVANSTITATVQAPSEQTYRIVLAANTEGGTSAFVRVVSATDEDFDRSATFKRLKKNEADTLKPVLAKRGVTLDPTKDEQDQLEAHLPNYKVADITIPAGQQVLRIHASERLMPVDGNPRRYKLTMFAPQLSFNPAGNVHLGVTVVFPLDFTTTATIDTPTVEPLPGQPAVNTVGGNPIDLGEQRAFGWGFKADQVVTVTYTYN